METDTHPFNSESFSLVMPRDSGVGTQDRLQNGDSSRDLLEFVHF